MKPVKSFQARLEEGMGMSMAISSGWS